MKEKEFENFIKELKSYFKFGNFGPHRINRIIDEVVKYHNIIEKEVNK